MTGESPGGPPHSDADEIRCRLTSEAFVFFCPECGEPATATVLLGYSPPTYHCDDCGIRWSRGDHENCVRCGKPLGSTDTICATCQLDLEKGER